MSRVIVDENRALRVLRRCCRLICHQKPERCFTYKGYLFPVCARCTGIIITFAVSLIMLVCDIYMSPALAAAMLLIMCADWLVQALKIKESTNVRRFITGLVGGFGISYVSYYIVTYIMSFLA